MNINSYKNYGSFLFEQGTAVISDDLNTRLKGYLDNNDLLTQLGLILNKCEDGKEYELTELNKEQFGILNDDRLFVRIDKSDKNSPKFFMWIMNDQYLWGDLDMDAAAAILKAGGEGTDFTERGVIGSISSFFRGNSSGDSGTDEVSIASLAGAFAQIAAEKSIDPQIYFDKLDTIFSSKYGSSIKDFMEEEFGGYAETVSCNTYRRKIEPSVLRGLNMWTILGDTALTIVTLGGSSAFAAGLRGAQIANATTKASKFAKVTGAAKASAGLGRGVKAIADITRLSAVFSKLDKARKIAALEKAGIKIGEAVPWITKGGKGIKTEAKIVQYSDSGVKMAVKNPNGKFVENSVLTGWDNVITQLDPAKATTVLTAANVNLTTKGLVAARATTALDGSVSDPNATGFEKGAEMLGYYDTLAADPNAYIKNAMAQSASDIASMILDLKNGSGIFGNTTDQEECAMALLITGLTPEMAKKVADEYKKIDAKSNVYSVLDDELEGDIGIFAKAYWTGCTGEGDDYKASIANFITRIKKSK